MHGNTAAERFVQAQRWSLLCMLRHSEIALVWNAVAQRGPGDKSKQSTQARDMLVSCLQR